MDPVPLLRKICIDFRISSCKFEDLLHSKSLNLWYSCYLQICSFQVLNVIRLHFCAYLFLPFENVTEEVYVRGSFGWEVGGAVLLQEGVKLFLTPEPLRDLRQMHLLHWLVWFHFKIKKIIHVWAWGTLCNWARISFQAKEDTLWLQKGLALMINRILLGEILLLRKYFF